MVLLLELGETLPFADNGTNFLVIRNGGFSLGPYVYQRGDTISPPTETLRNTLTQLVHLPSVPMLKLTSWRHKNGLNEMVRHKFGSLPYLKNEVDEFIQQHIFYVLDDSLRANIDILPLVYFSANNLTGIGKGNAMTINLVREFDLYKEIRGRLALPEELKKEEASSEIPLPYRLMPTVAMAKLKAKYPRSKISGEGKEEEKGTDASIPGRGSEWRRIQNILDEQCEALQEDEDHLQSMYGKSGLLDLARELDFNSSPGLCRKLRSYVKLKQEQSYI